VACRSHGAWTLWCLGYPEQGRTRTQEAIALAQQIADPFSLGFALTSAAVFHQFRREVRAAQERVEAAIRLAQDQGFSLRETVGAMLHGWILVQQGEAQGGIEQMHQSMHAFRATGAEVLRPYFLALLAEAHGTMRNPEAGLRVLGEALMFTETTRVVWYEPELYRLKGELLLQQNSDNQAEAETCFQQAMTVAQNQQAKSFELRAAISLARLWQQHGKHQEAHDLLAPVYGWFTEGFDTADLIDARMLLDELA